MDNKTLDEKYAALIGGLKKWNDVAIAFSSGVDSSFLLYAAKEALGAEHVLAITARSAFFPQRETTEARELCEALGIRQIFLDVNEEEIEGFAENPKNRCYLCKHALFTKILQTAKDAGMDCVMEGSNMDDNSDYRPGHQAIEELKIQSPLRDAGLYKADIRALSKRAGLPTAQKPSFACLASRFAYGERITKERLAMVEAAEQKLIEMGFEQFRVRIHAEGAIARIEVLPEAIPELVKEENRVEIVKVCRELGFQYVTMDLLGYRTGSMNEVLHV